MHAPGQDVAPCVWGTGPVPAAQTLALAFRTVMGPHLPLVTARWVASAPPAKVPPAVPGFRVPVVLNDPLDFSFFSQLSFFFFF